MTNLDFIMILPLAVILIIAIIFIFIKVTEIITIKLHIYGDFSIKQLIVVTMVAMFFATLYCYGLYYLIYYILGPNNFWQCINIIL